MGNEPRETEEVQAIDGLSRRTLLKRGAVAGAAVAWTVPLVSVLSMTPAHAESPSAPPASSNSGTRGPNIGVDAASQQVAAAPASGTNAGGLASTGSDVSIVTAAGIAATVLGAGAIAASKMRAKRDDESTATE
ncbi:MAG: hypothetical protein JWN95_2584 [Frankiales bacterium]|nr:hypothetical protein [Frankiales bacterium]